MRPLTGHEERNALVLRRLVGDVTYLQPTENALKKSIIDATEPVRAYLRESQFHDYGEQGQGGSHKVVTAAVILDDQRPWDTTASLYRPETKQGDPRIWISKLGAHAQPDDILAIFVHENTLYAYDLTRGGLADLDDTKELLRDGGPSRHPVLDLLQAVQRDIDIVADELRRKLEVVAAMGWVDAVGHGNTAIGRTLETILGIDMNSSTEPDYKGIEIKSSRSSSAKGTRQTLFAQVPDWTISDVSSSDDILKRFGYLDKNGVERLSVQVDHGKRNSKGLGLEVDLDADLLHEVDWNARCHRFATWRLAKLRERLRAKHGATFWVKAEARIGEAGTEQFHFISAEYSSDPYAHQLAQLIATNAISMDHLIKRKASGGAHEQGPLFKVDRKRMGELFPPMRTFDLTKP